MVTLKGSKLREISRVLDGNISQNMKSYGAIVAATSSHMDGKNNDVYGYCWPRDGAIVSLHQVDKGNVKFAKKFADYILQALRDDGTFPQRVYPDPDATKAPEWTDRSEYKEDMQIDQAAMVLKLLCRLSYEDNDYCKYKKEIRRITDSFFRYKCNRSVDLWEESEGHHFYTTSSVLSALYDSLHFELEQGIGGGCDKRRISSEIGKLRSSFGLFRIKDLSGDIVRATINRSPKTKHERGYKINPMDSSIIMGFVYFDDVRKDICDGISPLGADVFDNVYRSMVSDFIKKFPINLSDVDGSCAPFVGRYYDDQYAGEPSKDGSPIFRERGGNPWIICTADMGCYSYLRGRRKEGAEYLRRILQLKPKGYRYSEQVDDFSGGPIGAKNLTWSNTEVDRLIQFALCHHTDQI